MRAIKDGAVFIADSHYAHHGDEFLTILKKLDSGELLTTQLFLMGDIFDLLFGHNSYICTFVNEAITLLNRLSLKLEIHYFEGNHDFCLRDIFPNINVYSRDDQPVYMSLGDNRVGLSHGDKYDSGFAYNLYCRLLRNRISLNLLKPFQKWIIDYRMDKLSQKNIYHKFVGFEAKVERIMSHYGDDVDLVIEGHFHQAKVIDRYISLPSLACQKKIAIVENGNIKFINMV